MFRQHLFPQAKYGVMDGTARVRRRDGAGAMADDMLQLHLVYTVDTGSPRTLTRHIPGAMLLLPFCQQHLHSVNSRRFQGIEHVMC